MNIISD
jgi:Xaa-Pro aminopeptidase